MPEQISEGRGHRVGEAWEVVISRPLPAGLGPGKRSQVAFAVWDGEREECPGDPEANGLLRRGYRKPWTYPAV